MTPRTKKEKLVPAKKVNADILVPRLFFIVSSLVLVLFGLVMIFSASNVEAINNGEDPFSYVSKQLLICVFGIALAIFIWRAIPYDFWKGWFLWVMLIGAFILMLATFAIGTEILGAKRWIIYGPITIQPSEFVKIVLVLMVAKYYEDYRTGLISGTFCLLFAGGICCIFLAFILIGQSDLGTTVVCVLGIIALLWIAGIPKYQFAILIAICVGFGIFAVISSSYRSDRLSSFLNPYNDGAGGFGSGYQLIRSFYAFAEGGITGVGLGNSYEKYQYLPEAETDFIFSIVGEELGLIGCLLLLAVFSSFVVSGLLISIRSKSRFASSVSAAFVTMIGIQAVINIFCVIGWAPTTGKPLPFISYGGSSLISSLVLVGFVLAGSEADALPDEYQRTRQDFKVALNTAFFKDLFKGKEVVQKQKIEEPKNNTKQRSARTSRNTKTASKQSYSSPKISSSTTKLTIPKRKERGQIKLGSTRDVTRQSLSENLPKTTSKSALKSSKKSDFSPKTTSYAYRRKSKGPSFSATKSPVKRGSLQSSSKSRNSIRKSKRK